MHENPEVLCMIMLGRTVMDDADSSLAFQVIFNGIQICKVISQ